MNNKRYPCVLLINDIHVSKDNIPAFIANWDEALSICQEKGIKYMAVGGDLFQSRASQTLDVLLAVGDCLKKSGDLFILLANGNHDKVNQEDIRGYCHVYDEHDNVAVVNDFFTLTDTDWSFELHVMPYFPENGSFKELLNHVVGKCLSKTKKNFLYIHEGINGALAQSNEKELSPHLFKDFDRVFVGHYHNRYVIPGTQIEYIGSSRQHNFGEDEEKGYTILYSDGTHEFIKNRVNQRYRVIDVPVDKLGTALTDELEEIAADGKYRVKVKVHSPSSQTGAIDKKAILTSGASKVEIVTEDPEVTEIHSTSLNEKFDAHTIKENYKQFCTDKEIENVELGIQYLNQI